MTVNTHLNLAEAALNASREAYEAVDWLRIAEVEAQVAQAVTLDWLATMIETWIGVTTETWNEDE